MTTIYFVRHAEPNYDNHDDIRRELSQKGLQDSKALVKQFNPVKIDAFYSSPYKRALDTIQPLADNRQKNIHLVEDFRERKITDHWIADFDCFAEKQWADFSYQLPGGESLSQVQNRNIQALESLLRQHPNQSLVIGTHGTALATIINHYNPDFQFADFQRVKQIFPWLVKLEFQGMSCQSITELQQ